MRKFPLALLSLTLLSLSAHAQNDTRFLSWEHTLTTRSSSVKHPLAKLKIYNNWTLGKHRLLVKYNVAGLGAADDFISNTYGTSFSMPDFDATRIAEKASYHHGTLGLVHNLDDDRLTAYSSEAGDHGEYFVAKRKALMKRLRFDPWKKIAPELSEDDVPTLTAAQRKRLGREMRASLRPLMKNVLKTYFRPVKNTRTFTVAGDQIVAKGYRMTIMVNAGGYYDEEEWVRTSMEWWLAPEMQGDGVARSFLGKMVRDYRELGGPTTSMWMNETLPLMWASMPQAFHASLATLLPQAMTEAVKGSTPFNTSGTPAYAALTMKQSKPRYGRCPECGEYHIPLGGGKQWESIRLELQLQNRSTRSLAPAVFIAPPEYKKESIEPFLEEWEESVEMMQSIYDEETLLSKAPEHEAPPRYSWRALKDYTAKVRAMSLR